MGAVNHSFVNPKADSADTTITRPSDWNAAHAVDWGETGDIVTQDYSDTPAGGALDEIARADHRHGMPAEASNIGWFNVLDYGAEGSTTVNETTEIQAAINAANAAGGGIVIAFAPDYKVTSLNLKENVEIRGAGIRATTFHGTAGSDIFVLPAGLVSIFSLRDLTTDGGRRGLAYAHGAAGTYCTYVSVTNVEFGGPSAECVYTDGAIEEWKFDNVIMQGGTYGFRHANVDQSDGNNYIDKSSFKDVLTGGQTLQGWRIEAKLGNTCEWVNPIIGSAQQDGFYADGGLRSFVFVNPNTEGNGQSGQKDRTTGSISASSASLTVASPTGFSISDPITVEGAGANGDDLQTTISGIAGSVLTLAASASTTVSGFAVTNASYDDFRFNNTIATPAGMTFLGGIIGQEGGVGALRYAINGSGTTNLSAFGLATGDNIPIYMPARTGAIVSPLAAVRYPGARSGIYGGDALSGFLISGATSGSMRTQVPSAIGGNLLLSLRDSLDNGTGTFGLLEVRKSNSPHTRLFYIDGTSGDIGVPAGNLLLSGNLLLTTTILTTGTGSPESVVTAPVGSLFLRTDGSTSTTLYVKTSGSGNTGWTAK